MLTYKYEITRIRNCPENETVLFNPEKKKRKPNELIRLPQFVPRPARPLFKVFQQIPHPFKIQWKSQSELSKDVPYTIG